MVTEIKYAKPYQRRNRCLKFMVDEIIKEHIF